MIMAHERGAEIFAAFILMVQIASKCSPRGTLVRDNGTPHTASSLSVKCRAPASWFTVAIDYLEKHTDWIDVQDIASGCQHGASTVPARRQSGAQEGREGRERREGREAALTFSEKPSLKEWKAYCEMHGGPVGWFAEDKYLAADSDNWKGKSNWTAYADRCRGWWEAEGRPTEPPNKRDKSRGAMVNGQYQLPESERPGIRKNI